MMTSRVNSRGIRQPLFQYNLLEILLAALDDHAISGKLFPGEYGLDILYRISVHGHTALFHVPSGLRTGSCQAGLVKNA